jgi:hypothetical protein
MSHNCTDGVQETKQPPDIVRDWPTFPEQSSVDEAVALLPAALSDQLGDWWTVCVAPGSVGLRVQRMTQGHECRNRSPRGAVTVWSPGSRSRMVKRLATLDWSPIIAPAPGFRAAMVTLTYPGDWVSVCPSPDTAKKQLKAFRAAHARRWGQFPAVWKMEFQRRGAPHFHLYVPIPMGLQSWTVQGGTNEIRSGLYCEWLSQTWARIVGAKGVERMLHEHAGTGVDLAEANRMTDPKRISIYFTGHQAKVSGSKRHQHQPPAEWLDTGGTGRWWGVWTLKPVTATRRVSPEVAIEAKRTLRRYLSAQQRSPLVEVTRRHYGRMTDPLEYGPAAPTVHTQMRYRDPKRRSSPVSIWRRRRYGPMANPAEYGPAAPTRRRRMTHRRHSVRALSGRSGATAIVNNGPAVTAALSRWLSICDGDPPRP